jgi:hypothetical protein
MKYLRKIIVLLVLISLYSQYAIADNQYNNPNNKIYTEKDLSSNKIWFDQLYANNSNFAKKLNKSYYNVTHEPIERNFPCEFGYCGGTPLKFIKIGNENYLYGVVCVGNVCSDWFIVFLYNQNDNRLIVHTNRFGDIDGTNVFLGDKPTQEEARFLSYKSTVVSLDNK